MTGDYDWKTEEVTIQEPIRPRLAEEIFLTLIEQQEEETSQFSTEEPEEIKNRARILADKAFILTDAFLNRLEMEPDE